MYEVLFFHLYFSRIKVIDCMYLCKSGLICRLPDFLFYPFNHLLFLVATTCIADNKKADYCPTSARGIQK